MRVLSLTKFSRLIFNLRQYTAIKILFRYVNLQLKYSYCIDSYLTMYLFTSQNILGFRIVSKFHGEDGNNFLPLKIFPSDT